MNKKETLLEVNKLFKNNLHKAAIDLLHEYIVYDPNSSYVLSILGRAYLLDHQPEKAVIYLKKSLELKEVNSSMDNNPSGYQADSFDKDDWDYFESQAEEFSEEDYKLDIDEPSQRIKNKETQLHSNGRTLLTIDSEKAKTSRSDSNKNVVQIVYRGRRKTVLPMSEVSSPIRNKSNSTKEAVPNSSPLQANESSNNTIESDLCDVSVIKHIEHTTNQNNKISYQIKTPDPSPDSVATRQSDIDGYNRIDWEDDNYEYMENEQLELFVDDEVGIEDDGVLDEDFDDFLNPAPFPSIEDEPEELSWDDYGDVDEFDMLAQREFEEEVQDDGKISRELRARQVAVEVIEKSNWDAEHLDLLQLIFIENGWSAARCSIEREIDKGIQPGELALARKIRRFWSGNEQYWITFHKIKFNSTFQQTDATYKNMSWLESRRIINCFPSLPCIEEIYTFINETYDHWYNSTKLRRSFKAFFKYLKYRTSSMNRTLSSDYLFSFQDPIEADIGVDSYSLCNSNSLVSQELMNLGFHLNQWPRPDDSAIVIKELLND